MKRFADFWWLVASVTFVVYLFYRGAVSDLAEFNESYSGWGGFFSGFTHGLIGDFGYPGRVEEAQGRLISRAILWQNTFRFFFVASLIAGGLKLFWPDKRHKQA